LGKRGCKLLIRLVGERGFEPPTPWSRTRCSTRLSHSPNLGCGSVSLGRCLARFPHDDAPTSVAESKVLRSRPKSALTVACAIQNPANFLGQPQPKTAPSAPARPPASGGSTGRGRFRRHSTASTASKRHPHRRPARRRRSGCESTAVCPEDGS